MSLPVQVASFVERHGLLPPDRRVLVGISGGVDSVVLVHILHRLDLTLFAVHVNYQLRGEEADADEELVRSYCKSWGIPLHVERFDTKAIAETRGLSTQETARELRYELFSDVAQKEGLTAVAVAHHLNDQAETILLNLFRGAGPEGLAGMPVQREVAPGSGVRVIRPLLGVRRVELESYAQQEGLKWREDETNTSPDYTRSAVRTIILPAIEAHFGAAVRDNIVRAGDLVREYVDDVIRPAVDAAWRACAHSNGTGSGEIKLSCLNEYPAVMRRRVILEALKHWLPAAHYAHTTAEEIERLIDAQVGRRVEVGRGSVLRDRTALVFSSDLRFKQDSHNTGEEVRLGGSATVQEGTLYTYVLAEPPGTLDPGTRLTCYVDADALEEPLLLRSWEPGDRFRPLGMQHEKKVSDYLTDAKVPPGERHRVLVLCSGTRIVWLVGHRQSEDVKVTPETKRIAKFAFVPG